MKGVGLLAAALAGSLAACASPVDTRGSPGPSPPDFRTGSISENDSRSGYLMVFTPCLRVDAEGSPVEFSQETSSEPSYLVASGYSIYDQEGRHLYEIANHSSQLTSDEGPCIVALPPGRYLVVLDRPAGETRALWVTIVAQYLAEVDATRLGQVEI